MRKNKKYSKDDMYLAIELWQESGLSQVKFCSRENLSVKTFSYWYKKYKKGKEPSAKENKETPDAFIPARFPEVEVQRLESYSRI